MKLKNNTDFPDWFLRRMIAWICRNPHIDWRVKKIRGGVEVRNRSKGYQYSGHAWPSRERIVVSIGVPEMFRDIVKDENGQTVWDKDNDWRPKREGEPDHKARITSLVSILAHEIVHLAQWEKGPGRGKYSEREANWRAKQAVEAFVKEADILIANWMESPSYATKPKKAKPSIQEQRYQRALKNQANWERKIKLAKTKLAKYSKQVRYYEKALGQDKIAAKKRG